MLQIAGTIIPRLPTSEYARIAIQNGSPDRSVITAAELPNKIPMNIAVISIQPLLAMIETHGVGLCPGIEKGQRNWPFRGARCRHVIMVFRSDKVCCGLVQQVGVLTAAAEYQRRAFQGVWKVGPFCGTGAV